MRIRWQLFEFEDLAWFPAVVRTGMMDYLRFMITHLHTYRPIVPLLAAGLAHTRQHQVLELCAGAGGGAEDVLAALHQQGHSQATLRLTDLYPQPAAWAHLHTRTQGAITFEPSAVDALAVDAGLAGFRTVFSAFHHFPPPAAEALLRDAVQARRGIGVFEGAGKHWLELGLALTVLPVVQLLITPFIRPFSWSRLFFTYVVPLIPLCTIWDGAVSLLRMYSPEALLAMAHRADSAHAYHWQAGKRQHRWGPQVTYLIGWPRRSE